MTMNNYRTALLSALTFLLAAFTLVACGDATVTTTTSLAAPPTGNATPATTSSLATPVSAAVNTQLANAPTAPSLATVTAARALTTAPTMATTQAATAPATLTTVPTTAQAKTTTAPTSSTTANLEKAALTLLGTGWKVIGTGTLTAPAPRTYVVAYVPSALKAKESGLKMERNAVGTEVAIVQTDATGKLSVVFTIKNLTITSAGQCLLRLPEDHFKNAQYQIAFSPSDTEKVRDGRTVQMPVQFVTLDPQGNVTIQGFGIYWDAQQLRYRLVQDMGASVPENCS